MYVFVCMRVCVQSLKKTQGSVFDSPRAMGKLLKEAKRVKQVLSANIDHYAQVHTMSYVYTHTSYCVLYYIHAHCARHNVCGHLIPLFSGGRTIGRCRL